MKTLFNNLFDKSGMSNKGFAAEVGLKPCTISNMKKRKTTNFEVLKPMAQKLNITELEGIENGCKIIFKVLSIALIAIFISCSSPDEPEPINCTCYTVKNRVMYSILGQREYDVKIVNDCDASDVQYLRFYGTCPYVIGDKYGCQ